MKKEDTNHRTISAREFFLNGSIYKSVNGDLKAMEFPIEFCEYMLKGLVIPGHDITGKHDEYTELAQSDDIIEFVFNQLNQWKEIKRNEKSMAAFERKKFRENKTSAQDILNTIREKHSDK